MLAGAGPAAGRRAWTPGLRVPAADAVEVLLDAAEAFLALRAADGGTAWRAAELADAPARIGAGCCAGSGWRGAAGIVSAKATFTTSARPERGSPDNRRGPRRAGRAATTAGSRSSSRRCSAS